jgi:glyoxylase-like metal-dependent hydrolase (beta-lactamase superfamily II)
MVNIKLLTGGSIGTNCYIIEDAGKAVLVDYVPQAEAFVKKNGLNVEKILLTHIHYDHIEYLSVFQKNRDIKLYLSDYAYAYINDPEKNLIIFTPFLDEYNRTEKVNLDNAMKISDNDIIEWQDHSFKVLSSPGHSPDSVMYVLDEKRCVFSGDTLFYQSVGRTDFPGSSHEDMINSIKKLFASVGDDYAVYPGHGDRTSIGFEKNNNPFLI